MPVNQGLHNDQQRYISSIEWWLTYEAWKVIVCSRHMKNEVQGVFNVPGDKVEIIPNGVKTEKFRAVNIEPGFKNRFARDDEKVVFFVGRLVREKGVQVLIESAPSILHAFPNAKFVIAGKGPMEGELHYRARAMGLEDKILFTGYIDDETRNKLYSVSTVAVFPSLYEPFGIVALEAMAAGTPVVVSDTGGLSEIVTHGDNGLKAYPGNANSLANNIVRLLTDEVYAAQIKNRAGRLVKEVYDWSAIAQRTLSLYNSILREYRRSPWSEQSAINRIWSYAVSLMMPRSKTPEYWEERDEQFDSYHGRHYDLVNYRIAANNHWEGGE